MGLQEWAHPDAEGCGCLTGVTPLKALPVMDRGHGE
jgi:hypothetical protein